MPASLDPVPSMTTGPDFFVLGAHKAASTALCAMLADHPDVFVTTPKEPAYFSRDSVYLTRAEWYAGLFAPGGDALVRGEGSTTYSQVGVYPHTPARIAQDVPDARFLYVVRHPLDRMRAAFVQYRSQGRPDVPARFDKALRKTRSLVDASCYWSQYQAYRRHFDPERFLVLTFEDVTSRPVETMARAYAFLGVDATYRPTEPTREARNPTEDKRQDGALLTAARDVPAVARPGRWMLGVARRSRIGATVHDLVTRTLRDPLEPPEWDDRSIAYAVRRVRDDATAMLDFLGLPPDYWVLEEPAGRR